MKKQILVLLISLLSISAIASEQEFKVNDFVSVNILGNYKVSLIKSDVNKVKVINNDSDVEDENIIVENEGSELIVKLKKDTYQKRDIEFFIYYKEIFTIKARRGAYVVFKEKVETESVNIEVYSGAEIEMDLDVETANFTIKNGGSIDVKGHCENSNFYISKGGNISANKLITETTRAEVLFGGEISIHVTKSLFAVVKGGGRIIYSGKPKSVTDEIKMGGKIVKLDK